MPEININSRTTIPIFCWSWYQKMQKDKKLRKEDVDRKAAEDEGGSRGEEQEQGY